MADNDVMGILDEPQECQPSWSRISIHGWVIPHSKVKWIETYLENELIARTRIGNERRPDVATAYPSIPNAEKSGFKVLIPLGHEEGVRKLTVSARIVDGNLYQLGKRTVMNSRSAIDQQPEMFNLHLISQCNLSCIMCPAYANNSSFTSKSTIIDQSVLKATLSGLKYFSSNIKCVDLTSWGEPFLYQNIFQVIDQAHQVCPNANIIITTNGTMFSDRIINHIIDSSLTEITISLDAGSKATFEKIRKGANFEQVLEYARRLIDLRDRLGRKSPKIKTNFVLMRSNIHELPNYVRTAINIGVDLVGTAHPWGLFECDRSEVIYKVPGTQGKVKVEDYTNFIKEAQTIARQANVEFNLPPFKPTEPGLDCGFYSRKSSVIDPSGDVYPCCVIQALGNEGRASVRPIGNILNEPLPKIWNSSSYSSFREAFYTGELPDPLCAKCLKYYNL